MTHRKDKRTKLELQYEKLFKFPTKREQAPMPESLEQPSPLRIVPSVAAGSAYEEPIKTG